MSLKIKICISNYYNCFIAYVNDGTHSFLYDLDFRYGKLTSVRRYTEGRRLVELVSDNQEYSTILEYDFDFVPGLIFKRDKFNSILTILSIGCDVCEVLQSTEDDAKVVMFKKQHLYEIVLRSIEQKIEDVVCKFAIGRKDYNFLLGFPSNHPTQEITT